MVKTAEQIQHYNPDESSLAEVLRKGREIEARVCARPAMKAMRKKMDGTLVGAMAAQEARAVELASIHGIDIYRARLMGRSLNSLNSFAADIAEELKWKHGDDAEERAFRLAVPTDLSIEGYAQKMVDGGPDLPLAQEYLRVLRIVESVEQGNLIYAIGELAEVGRHLLGAVAEKAQSDANRASVNVRWGKRKPVIDWLVEESAAHPGVDPGRWLGTKQMLKEIRGRADVAGCKLSGGDYSVVKTCKKWLKIAGVS